MIRVLMADIVPACVSDCIPDCEKICSKECFDCLMIYDSTLFTCPPKYYMGLTDY